MTQETSNDSETRRTFEIINDFHRAFNRHAVDEIMSLMTEDCVFENTYPPPDGVRLTGYGAVRDFWIDLFQGSPQAHFLVEEVFACGDRGVLRWTYTWAGPDGQPGHVRGVDIFRVRAGKVAEKLSYVKG